MTTVLPTSPLTNIRDLGGIPVDGGTVRAGALFRADDVALVDEAGAVALVGDGVSLVIDLRSPSEAERTGRGVLATHPVDYLHLPLTQEVADPAALAVFAQIASAPEPERAMGEWYATLVRERRDALVRGIAAVADSGGAVVFHCAAGKDRTGIFAAAVLSVLGADRADIVTDYARTGENLPALLARLAAASAEESDPDRASARAMAAALGSVPAVLMSAPAGAMEGMLDALDADGGLVAVLVEAGLDDATIERLRDRLVA